MYLNSSLLFEALQKTFSVKKTGPVFREEHLRPPLLYYPGMALRPDQIYIGAGPDFDEAAIPPERCCIISVGPVSYTHLIGSCSKSVIDGTWA